jgi:UDP-N-acetyl-D-mannosaminuronic acid transferase (WecB/TagA/CpsF family)
MVEQNYKGYVIFFPKNAMFAGSWSVYLSSTDPRLRARLRAAEEVFTDGHGIDAAIAQARRRVDDLVANDACAS